MPQRKHFGEQIKFWKVRKQVSNATALAKNTDITAAKPSLPVGQAADVYNDCGVENYRYKMLGEALSDLNRAIKLKPNYPEPFYNRGCIYEELKEFDRARSDYRQARLFGLPAAYNNLARLSIVLDKDYNTAVELSLAGLQLAEEDEDKYALYKNQGWARLEQSRYSEAKALLLNAINLIPEGAAARCLLARVLEAQGNREGALVEWENFLKYASVYNTDEDPWIPVARKRLAEKERYQ